MKYIPKQIVEKLVLALTIIGEGDPIGVGLDEIKDVAQKGLDAYREYLENPYPSTSLLLVALEDSNMIVARIKSNVEKLNGITWGAYKEQMISHIEDYRASVGKILSVFRDQERKFATGLETESQIEILNELIMQVRSGQHRDYLKSQYIILRK